MEMILIKLGTISMLTLSVIYIIVNTLDVIINSVNSNLEEDEEGPL